MSPETRDGTRIQRQRDLRRGVGVWLFVAWMVMVSSAYLFFMLRSYF
jgi:hypothetical protein